MSLALAGAAQAQQQADLGPQPVTVASTPYTFDTAEQRWRTPELWQAPLAYEVGR